MDMLYIRFSFFFTFSSFKSKYAHQMYLCGEVNCGYDIEYEVCVMCMMYEQQSGSLRQQSHNKFAVFFIHFWKYLCVHNIILYDNMFAVADFRWSIYAARAHINWSPTKIRCSTHDDNVRGMRDYIRWFIRSSRYINV